MGSERAHIVRTDAVVLRGVDYGETSRIVTLFTRSHGRTGVMARGARGKSSRFGSTLQPMSHIQVVIHFKPNRDLQTLSESSHLTRFDQIGTDLTRLRVALRLVELVSALTQDGQEHPELLNLVVDTLARASETEGRIENLWPYFELRLAAVLGFAPSFSRAQIEAVNDDGGWLSLTSGQVSNARQDGVDVRASRAGLRTFSVFARAAPGDVLRMRLDQATRNEAQTLVDQYMRYHVEDAYPDRTRRVFDQILAG